MSKRVIVVCSDNAALCAVITALEASASVLMLEKAADAHAGGNTKYTAGGMRFAYEDREDLIPLLRDPDDPQLATTDFGSYTKEQFVGDTLQWLASHNVLFEPIYSRQSFERDGRRVFWGGLTLAAENENVGLFEMELAAFTRLGGTIRYNSAVTGLIQENDCVTGVMIADNAQKADAVVFASGGFQANDVMRSKHFGPT